MERQRRPVSLPWLPTIAAALALAACGAGEPSPRAAPTQPRAEAAAATGEPAATTPAPAATAATDLLPGPKDVLHASMRKFMAATRYHASMRVEGGPRGTMATEIDFVAPDRYRMTMPGVGTQTVIGDTMYMEVGGRVVRAPLPAGTLTQWRDPARLAENEAGMTVQAGGRDNIDGERARKYLVHGGKPGAPDTAVWIDGDGLPMQVRVNDRSQGRDTVATIRYTRFDDPSIRIEAPR
ncbi:MAG TPA: hypothetical protein VM619_07010 [Luteimonas sp.]|nr:hypothetical protein [Luteimonas sp.]